MVVALFLTTGLQTSIAETSQSGKDSADYPFVPTKESVAPLWKKLKGNINSCFEKSSVSKKCLVNVSCTNRGSQLVIEKTEGTNYIDEFMLRLSELYTGHIKN
jgi:hypothetical protein